MTHKVIAITGTIGSGKSTVAKYLKNKGYTVIDCDQLGKQVAQNRDVLDQIQSLLGAQCINPDGTLNRAVTRQTLFQSSTQTKQAYNQIFFDRIASLVRQSVDNSQKEIVFVEIPVLDAFEYPWYSVWRVESTTDYQLSRVCVRDNVSRQSVLLVLNSQKKYNADTVINNNGTLAQLYAQIDSLLATL